MPNLQQISGQLRQARNHPVQTTLADESISSDSPLYYSLSPVELSAENAQHRVCATEDEIIEGGQAWDLNPLIFYRVSKPIKL